MDNSAKGNTCGAWIGRRVGALLPIAAMLVATTQASASSTVAAGGEAMHVVRCFRLLDHCPARYALADAEPPGNG